MTTRRQLGEIRIDRIIETERPEFSRVELFPDVAPQQWESRETSLEPRGMDPSSGDLVLSIQTFLVRTPRYTMLIDTCVGDHKKRWRPLWTNTSSGVYLRRLATLGVQPEQVDHVICTHLHADHVGWNTRLIGGQWVPTFPNATYVLSAMEWAHWRALHATTPRDQIADSVLPIVESGQALLVEQDHAVTDEVRLRPAPGHTPGHVCIELASRGMRAVVTGDVMHHPVQCAEPAWVPTADADPRVAAATRLAFLERYCETDVLICASHFPSPSFGHVVRDGSTFRFRFDESTA
jgi:glyoxylase-like metal-dependent hydrolase (beta-lactamase superfamily II)